MVPSDSLSARRRRCTVNGWGWRKRRGTIMGERRNVRVDGVVLNVDAELAWMVEKLQLCIDEIVAGSTVGFSLIEIKPEGTRPTFVTLDGEHADEVADALTRHSMAVRLWGSQWEGNAPPAARSLRRQ